MPKVNADIRLKTGLEELDDMTNGGLIKNTVSIITGPPGCGKTLFSITYLYAGAKQGENGLYVSLEENQESIVCAARNIGFKDFEGLLKNKKIIVFDVGKMRIEDKFEDIMSVENILKHIQRLSTGAGVKFERIVIDSISAIEPSYTMTELRKALFKLFGVLRDMETTAIAVTEVELNEKLSKWDEAYLADTIIRLRLYSEPKYYVYSIQIPKMRYSKKSNKEYRYEITDDGLNITKRSVYYVELGE